MTPARALGAGLILTAAAGFVDATGFIALGGYYTSFMSGNTTQLGISVASGLGSILFLPAGLVTLFFIGSYLGTLVSQSARRWGVVAALCIVITGIAACLALHFAGFPPAQAMLPLALSAGAQNAALQPVGAARLGATFVTGTLFAAGQDLARATIGAAPPWRWAQHLLVWLSLSLGATAGALLYAPWQFNALYVPAAIYLAALGWFALRAPAQK